MPRPKPTGLPPEEEERLRKNRLLKVAATVFLEQGYQAASTNEIARRSNASKQTFYLRFPTKEKLFLAVIDYRTSMLSDKFCSIFAGTDTVDQVLTQTAHALLAAILSPEHIALLRIVYMEAPYFPEAAKYLIERGPDRGTNALAHYLKKQAVRGTLNIKHPRLAAQQFAGLVVGDLVHRALLEGNGTRPHHALASRVKASVTAFLKIYTCSPDEKG